MLGLAVLLHESLHETGARAPDDILGTLSGRAFEEGFAEAATHDLLPGLVAGLDLPADLRPPLLAAAGRYRPTYVVERSWARRMAAIATRSSADSPRARAWRIAVVDRWGADRWQRLVAATGLDEARLRAGAAGRSNSGVRRAE